MLIDEIELIEVTEKTIKEQIVVKNLLRMYCYEWSQYNLFDVNDNGEYKFEKCACAYWTEKDYHAFLIRIKGNWAGFVFIDQDFIIHKDYDYSMAEFFVMYKYRKNGVGRYVANKIFTMFQGNWEIGRNPKNKGSVPFWDHVINDYTKGHYETVYACPEFKYHDGTLGDVLSFEKKRIN